MTHLSLAGSVGRQQVNVWQFKPAQIQCGVIFPERLNLRVDFVFGQCGLVLCHFHFHLGR